MTNKNNQKGNFWTNHILPVVGGMGYHTMNSNHVVGLTNSNYDNFNNGESSNMVSTENFVVSDVVASLKV